MSVLTGKLARALIYTGRLTPHYNGLETCCSTWFQLWLHVGWRQMALKNMLTLGPHVSKCLGGAFLVAQWLRICLPMQGTWVQSLVWKDPICHNYWNLPRTCALQLEKPPRSTVRSPLTTLSSPCSQQTRESPRCNEDPRQPKTDTYIFEKKNKKVINGCMCMHV